MNITKSVFNARRIVLACMAALMLTNPAFADKPVWAGHHDGHQNRYGDHREYVGSRQRAWDKSRRQRDRRDAPRKYSAYQGGRYFANPQRTIIHNYYYNNYRYGHCPPGLVKKGNGCMPPGHARTWAIGRPLPRDVIYYDVPQPVLMGLGYPPPGYRFVRVASDILMIAIGTGLVMDAIYDLGGGWQQ